MIDERIALYIVNQSVYAPGADNGVGRAKLAGYFGCTPKTVAKYLQPLINEGLVREYKVSLNRGLGFKYVYNVTKKGERYLADNEREVYNLYCDWRYSKIEGTMKVIKAGLASMGKGLKKIKVNEERQKKLL